MRQTKQFTNLLAGSLLFLGCVFSPLLLEQVVFAEKWTAREKPAFSFQEQPGVGISGYVRTVDGHGLAHAAIYMAVAVHWPGSKVATTGPDGFYQSSFAEMPGDETIVVHAERACYTFAPAYEMWRHYYGHEERTIDFTAYPADCSTYFFSMVSNYLPGAPGEQ